MSYAKHHNERTLKGVMFIARFKGWTQQRYQVSQNHRSNVFKEDENNRIK
jgi:hypothetical protein